MSYHNKTKEELTNELKLLKQENSALKLANDSFRKRIMNCEAIFESSPVAMFIIDETTNIVMVNLAAVKLCGGSEEEILQHRPGNALRCVHSAKDPRGCGYSPDCKTCEVRNGIEKLIANGGTINGAELEFNLTKNGEPQKVWMNVGVEPVIKDGVTHWCIAMNDITKNKHIEESLRISEERFRGIFNNLQDAFFQADLSGIFTLVSPSALRMYGYDSMEEMIGMPASNLYANKDVRDQIINELQSKGETTDFVGEGKRKDGSTFWVSMNTRLLYQNGKVLGTEGIVRDISDRIQAEQRLSESQTLLKSIIDSTSDMIWSVDAEQFGLLNWNKSLHDYFLNNRGIEICTGMSPADLFPADSDYINFWTDIYKRTLNEGSLSVDYKTFSGQKILNLSLNHIKQESKTFGISIFAKDITEHNRAEEEIKESEFKYKYIFDNSIEGMYRTSIDGKALMANASLVNMLGFGSVDEYLNEMNDSAHQIWFNADERSDYIALLEKQEVIKGYECQLKRKDGSPVWVLLNAKLERDEKDNFLYLEGFITDITERKQAENKLQKANRLYAVISQVNQAIVHTKERDKLFMEICQIAIDFGKFQMAWIGMLDETTKLVKPHSVAGFDDGYLTAIRQIKSSDTPEGNGPTGRCIREGKYAVCNDYEHDPTVAIWRNEALKRNFYSAISLPIKQQGKIVGAFTLYATSPGFFDEEEIQLLTEIADDISFALETIELEKKHQQAEEALHEAHKALLRSQRMAKVGNWTFYPDSQQIEWSDEMYEIYGLDPAVHPISISNSKELIHPDDRKRYNDLVQLAISTSSSFKIDLRGMRPDGTSFHQTTWGELEVLEDGSRKLVGTSQDITEQKKAEKELIEEKRKTEESEYRLKLATASGKLGIWDWNLKDNTMIWDDRMFELYGISRNVFPNNIDAWTNGLHPEDKQMALDECNAALDGEKEFNTSFRVLHPDGTVLYLNANGSVIRDEDGTPLRMIGINRDITENRLAAKQLLIEKEKAEESDRLKSAFLANMSHEIRTPLNSIIGFSELIIDPDFGTEQHSEFAQLINENGNNLLTVISDIMDISKIEAGQMQVKIKEFSVNQLILSRLKEFSFKAVKKGIELRLAPSNLNEGIVIHSDSVRIIQILNNLINNAIKFTEKGFVEIGFILSEEVIQFHVKDTGIGIPTLYHDQIFERFRQVESAHTRRYGGNGLGLPISKSLVELLGGKIWMESEVGKGSTFFFTIPKI